jgi:hypothetical protein
MTEEIAAVDAETSTETAAATSAPKKRAVKAKYQVIRGAIAPYGGGPSEHFKPGTIVELSADLAKHYNALGYLKPYIED